MYFFDPNRGRSRRALVLDQINHISRQAGEFWDAASRDLEHRLEGAVCEIREAFSGEQVSDEVLVERIRSKMGRCLTHPRNIRLSARNGRVTLRGPILMREAQDLIQCVRSVHGVTGVVNELEIHERPGNLAALQGEGTAAHRAGLCQGNWSPGTRLLVGSLGTALVFRGMMQSFPASCVNGTIGLTLLARAFTSAPSPAGNRQRATARREQARARIPTGTPLEEPTPAI